MTRQPATSSGSKECSPGVRSDRMLSGCKVRLDGEGHQGHRGSAPLDARLLFLVLVCWLFPEQKEQGFSPPSRSGCSLFGIWVRLPVLGWPSLALLRLHPSMSISRRSRRGKNRRPRIDLCSVSAAHASARTLLSSPASSSPLRLRIRSSFWVLMPHGSNILAW